MKNTITVGFGIPEFNSLAEVEIKSRSFSSAELLTKTGSQEERTFKMILEKLPKRISKHWKSVEFTFQGERILVCKHWLDETGNDFSLSHEVLELEEEIL